MALQVAPRDVSPRSHSGVAAMPPCARVLSAPDPRRNIFVALVELFCPRMFFHPLCLCVCPYHRNVLFSTLYIIWFCHKTLAFRARPAFANRSNILWISPHLNSAKILNYVCDIPIPNRGSDPVLDCNDCSLPFIFFFLLTKWKSRPVCVGSNFALARPLEAKQIRMIHVRVSWNSMLYFMCLYLTLL
jgi:hypothetical protein